MLSPEQRESRRRYLGSSDAAAIVGMDPWRTPFDVWARLTGRLPDDPDAGPAAELGTYLEAGLLDYAEAKLGVALHRHVQLIHPDGHAACNLDALAPRPVGRIVEAKVSGLLGRPEFADEWGEPGTDEVPAHVLLQVHHQLYVANAQPDLADIAEVEVIALLGFRGFVRYRVRRHDDLVGILAEREAQFLRDHVEANVPPGDLPRMDTLKRLLRVPVTPPPPIDETLVTAWRAAAEARKAAERVEDEMKRAVLAALGDGDAGVCSLGTLTYREQTRPGHTVEPATYRVLRLAHPRTTRRRAA